MAVDNAFHKRLLTASVTGFVQLHPLSCAFETEGPNRAWRPTSLRQEVCRWGGTAFTSINCSQQKQISTNVFMGYQQLILSDCFHIYFSLFQQLLARITWKFNFISIFLIKMCKTTLRRSQDTTQAIIQGPKLQDDIISLLKTTKNSGVNQLLLMFCNPETRACVIDLDLWLPSCNQFIPRGGYLCHVWTSISHAFLI